MTSQPIMCLGKRSIAVCMTLAVGVLVGLALSVGDAARVKAEPSDDSRVYLPVALKSDASPICGNKLTVSGSINSNVVWSPTNLYIVDRDLVITPAGSLTILPGTVVKFTSSRGIIVEGKLTSNGTERNPVYFTSWKDDRTCGDTNGDGTATTPNSGDWSWIDFRTGSSPTSSIQRSVIKYGGRGGNTWRAPVRIYNISPTLENLSIEKSHRNAVQIVGGAWTSQVLQSQTVLYWLYEHGNVQIANGNTLEIKPGVKIKLGDGHGLLVHGALVANGTEANPIVLSSEKDDALCGLGAGNEEVCDTNDDGTGSVPTAGNWKWIEFSDDSSPNSSMQRMVIRYGGRAGSNWRAPIAIRNVSPTLEYLTIEHSHRNGVWLIGGNWTSQTLDSTTVVYWRFDHHLTVLANNTLTIMPGVKIKFDDGHGMIVNGALISNGTEAEPVVYTSEKDDTVCGVGVQGEPICDTNDDETGSVPIAGDWQWIYFPDGSDPGSSITYSVLRYGGREGGNWRAPIAIRNVSPTLEYLTIEHSHRNGVWLIGGSWTSQTLDSTTVVYWRFDHHLTVLANNTLTIMPGVKIKFDDGHGMIVNGALISNGTEAEPVVYTSEKDDTVCGVGVQGEPICDTNDDGQATAPVIGDWQWIEFRPGSSPDSSLRDVILKYGGRTGGTWRAVVMIVDAAPSIDSALLLANHGGIYFYDNASPILGCNDFEGNTYGAWNYNAANVVDMEGQWWGHISGPTHVSNAGGSGQVVSDGIDFTPWAQGHCTDFSRLPITHR